MSYGLEVLPLALTPFIRFSTAGMNQISSNGACLMTHLLFGAANSGGLRPSNSTAREVSRLGRDHNHYGFTVWMAGGGVCGGTVHGAMDDYGFQAVENLTCVHDLHATILHLMGLDNERLTFLYVCRDFRLPDVLGKVIHNDPS